MSQKTDKRQENRFPLPGHQVEIMIDKWGKGVPRSCRLVDLSSNGLSFVTHDNYLAPLDKIAFRLQIGEGEAEGRAVICYRRSDGEGKWRYGAMYLKVDPEIESLVRNSEQTGETVRVVAEEVAEKMFLDRCHSAAERRHMHAKVILTEASTALLRRLKVLKYPLHSSIEIDIHEGVQIGGNPPLIVIAEEDGNGFRSSEGEQFANIFEVLEFLSERLAVSQSDR